MYKNKAFIIFALIFTSFLSWQVFKIKNDVRYSNERILRFEKSMKTERELKDFEVKALRRDFEALDKKTQKLIDENRKLRKRLLDLERGIKRGTERVNTSGWKTGKASWYGGSFHGRKTASGEVYNKYAMTCAAADWIPMGSILQVKYGVKIITVRVNDRGAFEKHGRTLDLSEAAFKALAPLSRGVITVKWRVKK